MGAKYRGRRADVLQQGLDPSSEADVRTNRVTEAKKRMMMKKQRARKVVRVSMGDVVGRLSRAIKAPS